MRGESRSIGFVLGAGAAFALAGGLIDALYRLFLGPLVLRDGPEVLWEAPAGTLVSCVPFIVLAALAHAIAPRTVSRARIVFLSTVLPALGLGLLLLRERVPDAVQVILALGIASVA